MNELVTGIVERIFFVFLLNYLDDICVIYKII